MKMPVFTWIVPVFLGLVFGGMVRAQDHRQRIERTDEKELKVKIEYAAGHLHLKKVGEDLLCQLSAHVSEGDLTPKVEYQKNGTTGFLSIGILQDENLALTDFGGQNWTVEITDKIPLSLNLELGASKSALDFSDLRLRDVNVALGASSSKIDFNSVNRDRMNKLKIEAGMSKLTATGLCNANFERFDFEGGVGSYVLDFSGHLSERSSARISVGVGKLRIRIPKATPVKLHVDDNFLSSFQLTEEDLPRSVDDVYVSEDLDEDRPYLDIRIEAGIGQVVVEIVK